MDLHLHRHHQGPAPSWIWTAPAPPGTCTAPLGTCTIRGRSAVTMPTLCPHALMECLTLSAPLCVAGSCYSTCPPHHCRAAGSRRLLLALTAHLPQPIQLCWGSLICPLCSSLALRALTTRLWAGHQLGPHSDPRQRLPLWDSFLLCA